MFKNLEKERSMTYDDILSYISLSFCLLIRELFPKRSALRHSGTFDPVLFLKAKIHTLYSVETKMQIPLNFDIDTRFGAKSLTPSR